MCMKQSSRSAWGFTMIELLAVIGIIGVLASMAVPSFRIYRSKAFDAEAIFTLRVVTTAEEAYFVDWTIYKDCDQSTCPLLLPNLELIPVGVILSIASTPTGYTGLSSHIKGTGEVFTYP